MEAHDNAVALHLMYYNFVRIHASLRMTPTMAAGVTGKLWEIGDIVADRSEGSREADGTWALQSERAKLSALEAS